MDHNILTIGVFLLGTVIAILGILMRGWFKHVNDNLDRLWERYDAEARARETRWAILHDKCEIHSAQIAELKGRLDGKAKAMGMTAVKE